MSDEFISSLRWFIEQEKEIQTQDVFGNTLYLTPLGKDDEGRYEIVSSIRKIIHKDYKRYANFDEVNYHITVNDTNDIDPNSHHLRYNPIPFPDKTFIQNCYVNVVMISTKGLMEELKPFFDFDNPIKEPEED